MDVSSEQLQTGTSASADGTVIYYDLYPGDSNQLVLIVPGFWRTRNWPTMGQLARLLNQQGFHAAVVDVRGHGDSGGTYTFNLREHDDVYAVARDLQERLGLQAIALIGFSIGGSIAACTVAKHPDLRWRALMLVSPVAKFSKIRPSLNPFTLPRHLSARAAVRPPRFTWRFFTSRKLCAADEMPNVHVPVSIVHMKKDWLVHHRHGEMLYRRANEPKEWNLIDRSGRYHADRLLVVAPEELEAMIRHFLNQTMQRDLPANRQPPTAQTKEPR